ncbi:hypothetical protein MPSI1_000429 [Malassezia psittaci]|uniref:Glycosylphosphatidylinositol anchor biosynthesis protein 11 n=1 Tax=Malassezia psittaci TaxID=1821823 RepID=A0AAF0F378_9BASI|nr:hypothetical protein MPSI1_000429 [Malassezia psittaci]
MDGAIGAWPVRHQAQWGLAALVLQPLLLLLTFVDFARLWPDSADSIVLRVVVGASRILRPGIGRDSPATSAELLREASLSLQGVYITQAWFCARMASWHSVSEAYEAGAKGSEIKAKAHTVGQQLERIVMTTTALPLLILAAYVLVVVFGAPINDRYRASAVLAAYLALLILFPVAHILGTPPSALWTRILAAPQLASPRETLVLVPSLCAVVGTLVGSLALALDWGESWQTYPLPCVYGAVAGLICGNVLAMLLASLQSRARPTPQSEAIQPPSTSARAASDQTKSSTKKNKKAKSQLKTRKPDS